MRIRLILSFALIVLVSVTSVVLIARWSAAKEVYTFMFRGGMSGNQGLVGTLENYYQTHQSWDGADVLLSSVGNGQGRGQGSPGNGPGMGQMMNQKLLLADSQGNVVAETGNPSPAGRLSEADLAGAIPLMVNDQVVGYLIPEAGIHFTQADEARLVNGLNNAALTAGLITGGVSLLLALLLAYQLIRPVHLLTAATEKLARGDLNQRVAVRGNDELATLGYAFNSMASSLQQAEETRRAMTADIAHELRNPLAVQRANLEAMIDKVYPLTIENINPVLEQNQLLTRLVGDLQTLALTDAGQLHLERIPTDFSDLVKRIVERFVPQADSRQIHIDIHSKDRLPLISLDSGRVEQILGNLLSNALRYTPDNGQISLEVSSAPSEVQLSVHDSGPGIPEESLPHIFDRFYRADRSRSRAEGGAGLGLTIARQLAEAHGGRLIAHNHPEGGAVIILTLPYD